MILGILGLLSLMLVVGCFLNSENGIQNKECMRQLFAMDTVMSFTAYGKNSEAAVDAAMKEIQRLDGLLSTGNPSSEVYRVNSEREGTLSEDTIYLYNRAMDIYESTEGVFDITIYPLMELWGFPTKEYRVPSGDELENTLKYVDASRIVLEGNLLTLAEGQKIDFGGIAKGYASARVMEIFQSYGIKSGMVSLGGNVQTLGKNNEGRFWRIGISNPKKDSGGLLGVLEVSNQAVISSGGYERYFEADGNTYIHILDPKTGYPADAGLISATIISGDGTLADALSTSIYLMGLEKGTDYWREHREEFDMILMTDDGVIYVTEGIEDDFVCQKEYEVIR